jgi:hypothetical protein
MEILTPAWSGGSSNRGSVETSLAWLGYRMQALDSLSRTTVRVFLRGNREYTKSGTFFDEQGLHHRKCFRETPESLKTWQGLL